MTVKFSTMNMTVRNKNTGTIHWGTVNTETQEVTRTHCLKPVGGQYEPADDEKMTCKVCKAKLHGAIYGVYSPHHPQRRRRRN